MVGCPGTVATNTVPTAEPSSDIPSADVHVHLIVYVPPLVNPVIVNGDEVPVSFCSSPVPLATHSYSVMAAPPVSTGGLKTTIASPLPPRLATIDTGGSGFPFGVNATDAVLASPGPALFVAVHVAEY